MKAQVSTNKYYLFLQEYRWLPPLLLGIVVSSCMAIFVYKFSQGYQRQIPESQSVTVVPLTDEAELNARLQDASIKKEFGFYEMLEGAQTPALPVAPMVEIRYHYFLQVGSFAKADEADTLKALLTLNGLEPTLQVITLDTKVWYRIVLGPWSTPQQADKARQTLQGLAGEGTLIIKQPIKTGE